VKVIPLTQAITWFLVQLCTSWARDLFVMFLCLFTGIRYVSCVNADLMILLTTSTWWICGLELWRWKVANATHDRQHADKVFEEYVTTTITDVISNFFGSQFSEQSTAVKVTQCLCILFLFYLTVRFAYVICFWYNMCDCHTIIKGNLLTYYLSIIKLSNAGLLSVQLSQGLQSS